MGPRWIVGTVALSVVAAGCGTSSQQARTPRQPRPSTNPYVASLAYARCLRGRGVPQPLPDRKGEFTLTEADEQRLRRVPKRRREAAIRACFHDISGLNNDPLSQRAHQLASRVLLQLKKCLAGFGVEVGHPVVRNMSFGRAMFGFEGAGGPETPRRAHAQQVCERRVDLAGKLTRIINEDRRAHRGGF